VIGSGALGFVPGAFVGGDHFAGVTGDAAVGEELRRVGEDEVDGGFGEKGEEFEGVALVEADVALFVLKTGAGSLMGDLVMED